MARRELLDEIARYGREPHHAEQERVHRAILKLGGGDLDRVRQMTDAACLDYRDVLLWAEYLREGRLGERIVARDCALTVLSVDGRDEVRIVVLVENMGSGDLSTSTIAVDGESGEVRVRSVTLPNGGPAPSSIEPRSSVRLLVTVTGERPLRLTFWSLSLGAEPIAVTL
jgi:hypothetical protein